jgi:hypothetical protein
MITIDTWKGLVTNGSPYALPPGAAVVQTNFQCRRPGELSARGGQTAATFSTTAGCTVAIIEMFRCPIGASESVVVQGADGNIYVAKGLT